MARYASEGEDVITIIFSKGEASHPWLDPQTIHAERIKETEEAAGIVGVKKTYFLDLRDGKLVEDAKNPEVHKKIRSLIAKYDPDKIFTHALDDVLYGHRAVYTTVLEVVRDIHANDHVKRPQVWGFNVWTMNVRQRMVPKLIVDISATFELKRRALRCFKSQRVALYQLYPFIYARAFFNGIDADVKYAESFVRLL